MSVQDLSPFDLGLASLVVLALAGVVWREQAALGRSLLLAALRMALQLVLVALVLEAIFAQVNPWLVAGIGLVMVLLAGREVAARLKHRRGDLRVAAIALFISSYGITLMALLTVVRYDPWYHPQYAIPLLGMVLGNSLNSITLAMERLREGARHRRQEIEGRLMLGQPPAQALQGVRRDALNAALLPTINAMAAAGIVALPGMMTGQILAGSAPVLAVKYQILIFLLIAVSTTLGALIALWLGARRLFDERARLRARAD